ncbi:MAG: CAP domain-containing protein [Pirellulales bacterium]|nr:CAP domain-containing protein [Pirellulales bacterium]
MIVRISLCASVLFILCGPAFGKGDTEAAKPKVKPAATKDVKKEAAKPQAKPDDKKADKLAAHAQTDKSQKKNDKPKVDKKKPNNTDKKIVKKTPRKFKLLAIEKNIAIYTNHRRTQHGLRPLVIDENLVKSARQHAIWMARSRRLQHTSQPVAENIAMGYSSSQGVVQGWMNSSGHRANILNGGYSRIGTAAYEASDGTVYWCQQFLR